MKITFLGTGTSQGVPVISCNCPVCKSDNPKDKRLRSSVLIEINNKVLVIDTGPDFRQQMLRENVDTLDGILITHEHKDHVAGLDDVRAYNFKSKAPVDLYAEARAQKSIRREFAYVFAYLKYPGIPEIRMHTFNNKMFNIKGIDILPIRAKHFMLPVFGYRIENFTYITDTNHISKEEQKKIIGSEVLVLNALRKKKHISHYNLEEALDLINKIKPKKAYLTHMSHLMGFHDEVEKELPENVKLGYDGLKIYL